ncbi:hypothetical protein SUGI_0507510 [Cryptomeria japonica]|nr:hypothetical protein SUGI_0507510 [Cryptomeria japonica]
MPPAPYLSNRLISPAPYLSKANSLSLHRQLLIAPPQHLISPHRWLPDHSAGLSGQVACPCAPVRGVQTVTHRPPPL